MSSTTTCTSCCLKCANARPGPETRIDPEAFGLDNLLRLGTISITLGEDSRPEIYCEHVHASDGWHPYGGTAKFLPLTSLADVRTCQGLEFLVKHQFIDATYRIHKTGRLIARIYLIPYDLPGARGVLHNRKDVVLGPGKRYLQSLLPRVVADWEGNDDAAQSALPDTKDGRTLAEIYSELCSPDPGLVRGYGDISSRLQNHDDDLAGLGLRSELYGYQRMSVATLLEHELSEKSVPNPLYIPLSSLDGKPYYFQPGTSEVLLEKQMVTPGKGGILCEELGTGKTVMIIALILATLHQLPSPEESLLDDRPILTPLSFRHFPSSECVLARKRLGHNAEPTGDRVPSLVEMLLHRIRTAPDNNVPNLNIPAGERRSLRLSSSEEHFEKLPFSDLCNANVPFYFHHLGEPERTKRGNNATGPKRMYLSAATLVVVPANLLSQWDREIIKHAELPLRTLIARTKTEMPPVRELATNYDVILMTYNRFTVEATQRNTMKLHSWKTCQCPEFPGSRVPNCRCQVTNVSPFLQIRWKRLVIDEGHVSASLTTTLTPFAKLLSVERRWIVTGTPTTNLLGLGLGKRTIEESTGAYEDDDILAVDEAYMQVDSHDTFLGSSGHTPLSSSSSKDNFTSAHDMHPSASQSPAPETQRRVWNKYDRGDLRKLGNMITHFVAVPQFAGDPKLMTTNIIEPLLDRNGPRPGSIPVLNQIMNMVMIRHRVEDVEKDVVLPPLVHESVLLELDPLSVISYNALQAIIAINAVDSERKDQDYLFHPSNAEYLQETVKNMSQLMFWRVDEQLYNVKELAASAPRHIKMAMERGASAQDMKLLHEAFRHVMIAANDELWEAVQQHEDVLYRIYSMPQTVFDAWRRTPNVQLPDDPSFMGYLHADRLVKMYHILLQKPLISELELVNMGHQIAHQDAMLRQAYQNSQRKHNKSGSSTSKKQSQVPGAETASSHGHSQIADSAVKKAGAKETLREMQTELGHSMALLEKAADDDSIESISSTPNPGEHRSKLSKLASASCLVPVRIGSSTSTELNYIIKEVMQHSATEKFLIFSDSELTLAHVAEALKIIHVKFLRFTAQIPAEHREQMVLTFETCQPYRVFLMELKHGARGLNLVSASRVIFCEPVWHADVESQAMKRVHRIGQTRPITVKTLAIKGTAEEAVVSRRHALHNIHDKLPKLIEEPVMRDFIANPKFIQYAPQSTGPQIEIPLVDLPALDTTNSIKVKIRRLPSDTVPRKRITLGDPIISGDEESRLTSSIQSKREGTTQANQPEADDERPAKRKRTVRFA
ncbi:hypothetical protein FA15DRAFT_663708 [Coprinopsis marcescibilis]|uniref:Uncharacterized protein n=1 Tax=Coprinopsis marcescibilis TaxID=230819 RepID=A0A5C3LCX9_COPMA|nr:hypothetical protein FA15DRAFT_663708 [Coprinopsis marcescibilis]